MTVGELIEKLKSVDPDMDVFCNSSKGEFDYGLVNSASKSFITFHHPDKDEEEMQVFLIDEE